MFGREARPQSSAGPFVGWRQASFSKLQSDVQQAVFCCRGIELLWGASLTVKASRPPYPTPPSPLTVITLVDCNLLHCNCKLEVQQMTLTSSAAEKEEEMQTLIAHHSNYLAQITSNVHTHKR